MELWDLYDEQRRLVGTDHLRGQELPDLSLIHICP